MMTMNIARKALLLMASLPSFKMATYGTVLQRRVAAFSSVAWTRHRSPKSPSTRQHQMLFRASTALRAPVQHRPLSRGAKPTLSRRLSELLMASEDDDGSDESSGGEPRTSFNMAALKKETTRLTLRTHKKIGKVSTRIRGAEEQYEKLRVAIDTSSSEDMDEQLLQQLEQAPNVGQHKDELSELKNRLKQLNWLEEQFAKPPLKSKKQQISVEDLQNLSPEGAQVVRYVLELDISDDESRKQKLIEENARNRRSKKERSAQLKGQNQQQQGGRLPYRRYYTEQNLEIRVSRGYDV